MDTEIVEDSESYIHEFYYELNKYKRIMYQLKADHDMSFEDIILLIYISNHGPVERRSIIEHELINDSDIVACLKKLYEKKLIKKQRPINDSRTVIFSINTDHIVDINLLLSSAETIIRNENMYSSHNYQLVPNQSKNNNVYSFY